MLYDAKLAKVAEAQARQRLRPTADTVNAVLHAVESKRPKPSYTAGPDARLVSIASRLPAGLRDRLVLSVLGLAGER